MSAYYNEIDPFCAKWLRALIAAGHIAPGDVDERSIELVRPDDLRSYRQCHFFAGIGGWSYALRLAGWDDEREVWTGSCPCQPFSEAGKGAGFTDRRHLWPAWLPLIRQQKPPIIFGEQVTEAIRHGWLDSVADDLEAEGYAVGSALLPACAVGAFHVRERVWFLADTSQQWRLSDGRQQHTEICDQARPLYQWPSESGLARVADGIPDRMAQVRAFGNAIVPQVAAEFIRAYMEVTP